MPTRGPALHQATSIKKGVVSLLIQVRHFPNVCPSQSRCVSLQVNACKPSHARICTHTHAHPCVHTFKHALPLRSSPRTHSYTQTSTRVLTRYMRNTSSFSQLTGVFMCVYVCVCIYVCVCVCVCVCVDVCMKRGSLRSAFS